MHELAVTQAIVEAAREHAGEARVVRVVLAIGKLSGVSPEAVRFCFDLCCEGTQVAGAALVIQEPPGAARCRACGEQVALEEPLGQCGCGSLDLEWLSGTELRIREIEVI